MAETLKDAHGIMIWGWADMMHDLVEQGGLEKGTIWIDPFSVRGSFCGGTYKENQIAITWSPDKFLLVSVNKDAPELIDAFSAVVEYKPFCKYTSKVSNLLTYEWDKIDPQGRWKELEDDGEQLEKIE